LSDAVIGFAAAASIFTLGAALTARRDKELTA
jgi:cytosine permease